MVDRRFIDAKLIIKGFAASAPNKPKLGDAYIVSQAWGDSYPNAVVNSIAKYKRDTWTFVYPSESSSLEVINPATNEILNFSAGSWTPVCTLGGAIYPYVVDAVYIKELPENTEDKVGQVYIAINLDDNVNVYKIISTAEGDAGRKILGSLGLGEKVILRTNGYMYKATSRVVNEATINYFIGDGYVPKNTLIFSQKTNGLYLSQNDFGEAYPLIRLSQQIETSGENYGLLTMQPHTFTAEEIATKHFYLPTFCTNNEVWSLNSNKIICFLGGNVCVNNKDFKAQRDTSKNNQVYISWNFMDISWNESPPQVGEVGIVMYYKF